jgi:hypothetical protein
MQLLNATITTAATATGSPFQIRTGPQQNGGPLSVAFQKLFTYGSGGTNVQAYLQTSFDGGNTWADVLAWAVNTTASDARPFVNWVNNLAAAAVAVATTDGTMTTNTVNAGMFGLWWRVKYVSTGTYAGNTTLTVWASCAGAIVPAGVGSFN